MVYTFALYVIGLRFVLENILEYALYVPLDTAFAIGKVLCHYGIKAHTAGGEERSVIHQSVVHVYRFAGIEHLNGAVHAGGYIKVSCEAIAAAVGDNTECGVCADKSAGYFVNGAIAAYGNDGVVVLHSELLGKLGGVSCVFGDNHGRRKLLRIQQLTNELRQTILGLCTRNRVHDKCYILHFFVIAMGCFTTK